MVTTNGTVSNRVEVSWADVMASNFPPSPQQQLFIQTVLAVAASAKASMPEASDRVDKARDMVLAQLVEQEAPGLFRVASGSERGKSYAVSMASGCECPGAQRAEDGRCKHLIATWILRRVQAQLAAVQAVEAPAAVATTVAAAPQLPEAPASVNVSLDLDGRRVQVTLRDQDETRLLARLKTLLAQYPASEAPAAQASAPVQQPTCRFHGADSMRESRYGGWICSAKDTAGEYCNQKWPRQAKAR